MLLVVFPGCWLLVLPTLMLLGLACKLMKLRR